MWNKLIIVINIIEIIFENFVTNKQKSNIIIDVTTSKKVESSISDTLTPVELPNKNLPEQSNITYSVVNNANKYFLILSP